MSTSSFNHDPNIFFSDTYGFGETTISQAKAKDTPPPLEIIDKTSIIGKIVSKIINIVSYIFPCITRFDFTPEYYSKATKNGIVKSLCRPSVSKSQLSNYIEKQCKQKLAPSQPSPNFVKMITEKMIGNKGFCQNQVSLSQFFKKVDEEIEGAKSNSSTLPTFSSEPQVVEPNTVMEEPEFVPPPPVEIKTAKIDYAKQIKEKLSQGSVPLELLKQAILDLQPEAAVLLIERFVFSADNVKKAFSLIGKIPPAQFDKCSQLCNWLQVVAQKKEINPDNLDHYALDMGYGYKSANLMVLENKAKKLSESVKGCEIKVPPFMPISDFEMQNYLMDAVPDLADLWKKFLNSFDPSLKAKFLDPNVKANEIPIKITPGGLAIIQQIQSKITNHFNKNPYHTVQIKNFLSDHKPAHIIVRSTGKEDSDKNSNAGGNDSIPFVLPDAQKISEAMGKVIASYFGEKSVNQRLTAGDRSVFTDEKPFIPVLLQVMIGENAGGKGSKNEDVPRSGVLFTRQQDKAEGVTFIQAGVGNNEGVVTSQVDVDSYYVGADKRIHSVIRRKESRFVHFSDGKGGYKVGPMKNKNKALEEGHALPSNVVLDLKTVADDISKTYGKDGAPKAMDMEYTVKLKDPSSKKPVIYLLQARPLMDTNHTKIKKSFLDLALLKHIPKGDQVQAQTLLDGNSYTRVIQDADEVIFADDLEKALALHTAGDHNKIKLIVTKKTAPGTSHASVTLRPRGVAVLVVENPEEFLHVKNMVVKATSAHPVLACPQRGIIVDTAKAADPKAMIKEGLVSYPIPLEVSLPKESITNVILNNPADKSRLETMMSVVRMRSKLIKAEAEKLLKDTGIAPQTLSSSIFSYLGLGATKHTEPYTIRELFDEMAMGTPEQAKKALGLVIYHLQLCLAQNMKKNGNIENNNEMYRVYEAAVKLASKEILPALEKYPAQSMNRLYAIKFLEALVFQKYSEGIVRCNSYADIIQNNVNQDKLKKIAKDQGIAYTGNMAFLLLVGGQGYSKDTMESWKLFLQELGQTHDSSKGIAELSKMVKDLNTIGITSSWLNLVFKKVWDKAPKKNRAQNVLDQMLQMIKEDKQTLDWIGKQHEELKAKKQQVKSGQWSNPAFAKKQIPALNKTFVEQFGFDPKAGPGSLKGKYDSAHTLGKLAILQFMGDAVTTFDETIKAVKGSDQYSEQKQQVQNFGEMLKTYFEMMQGTLKLISWDDENKMMEVNMGHKVMFNEYVQKLRDGLTYKFGFSATYKSEGFDKIIAAVNAGSANMAQQLEARPEFAVDSLTIGSKADLNFSTHWPNRLEEYFTTFHQVMEKVKKHLNTKCGMDSSVLPEGAKKVAEYITSQMGQTISHISQEGSTISVVYQIPLRQHSSTIELQFDAKNEGKGLQLVVKGFGNDEHDRWDQSVTFGAFLANKDNEVSFAQGIPPKINYNKQEGFEFTLHLPVSFKQEKSLIKTLHYILKTLTMGSIAYYGDGRTSLITAFQSQCGAFDWHAIGEKFFADSFYLNNHLMMEFANKNDHQMTVKIAKNSLLGLARQGIKDYTRQATGGGLAGYLGNAQYGFVAGNHSTHTNSVKLTATLHLIKGLKEKQAYTRPIVEELIKDPDIVKNQPETVAALTKALMMNETPEKQFQTYWNAGKYVDAIILAKSENNAKMLATVLVYIDAKIGKKQFPELIKMAKELYGMGYTDEADQMIVDKIKTTVDPTIAEELVALKRKKDRKIHLSKMDDYAAILQKNGAANNFEASYKETLAAACNSLIGLSQTADYNKSYQGGFTGLAGFLNNRVDFDYVQNNVYPDTSKLYKAAVLFIAKGLTSKNNAIFTEASKVFSTLIEDFLASAQHGTMKDSLAQVLYGLSSTFFKNTGVPTTGAYQLVCMWQSDSQHLNAITAAYPNITKNLIDNALVLK